MAPKIKNCQGSQNGNRKQIDFIRRLTQFNLCPSLNYPSIPAKNGEHDFFCADGPTLASRCDVLLSPR